MPFVVVVGQGYVGLPLAMRAVAVGHRVVGFDTDRVRVARLGRGDSYVEDVAATELAGALGTGRYVPTGDEAVCDGYHVGVITVPTPLRDGVPDLSYIEEAGRMLGRHLQPGACVILESTTYPGTTVELLVPILEKGSGLSAGADFHVGYSPERIDPGNPTWGLVNTPKVVSGIDAASLTAVQTFYGALVEHTVTVSRTQEAELVKLIENTFRHVSVAMANEMAMFAGELGLDIWEALSAAESKPFGFMRFSPGPGVGGHCLPVDPRYLSWQSMQRVGAPFRFVELANDINDHMPDYVVRRLMLAFNQRQLALHGRRVLLLGLAYKRNTSDARESPALVVAERLLALGADVWAVDPHVRDHRMPDQVKRTELTPTELEAADAVVVLTDHDAFDWDMVLRHATYVFDTRARLTGDTVEHL